MLFLNLLVDVIAYDIEVTQLDTISYNDEIYAVLTQL